jgi:hypothetical protein
MLEPRIVAARIQRPLRLEELFDTDRDYGTRDADETPGGPLPPRRGAGGRGSEVEEEEARQYGR